MNMIDMGGYVTQWTDCRYQNNIQIMLKTRIWEPFRGVLLCCWIVVLIFLYVNDNCASVIERDVDAGQGRFDVDRGRRRGSRGRLQVRCRNPSRVRPPEMARFPADRTRRWRRNEITCGLPVRSRPRTHGPPQPGPDLFFQVDQSCPGSRFDYRPEW